MKALRPLMQIVALVAFVISLTPFTFAAGSQAKTTPSRKPASVPGMGGHSDLSQPLEIKGQSRMLNMRLMIQSKKEKLKFVEPRRNYHDEIVNTHY